MVKKYKFLTILVVVCAVRVLLSCSDGGCEENPDQNKKGAFESLRQKISLQARKHLPSPQSELLLGMTIGLDELYKVPTFKKALRDTGTIHVVVVSGFNISLVFGLVIKLVGSRYKLRNLLFAQAVTLFYSLLSGFDPPVVRSWVMGSIAAWGKYYGRTINTIQLLIFSGTIMILVNPSYLFSLSFQLSFFATVGLVLSSDIVSKLPKMLLLEDFYTTVAAQIFVLPLLSYSFGTVGVIGPLVNTLILWTVSFSTVLGGLFLLLAGINGAISLVALLPLYALLTFFVVVVRFFGSFPLSFIRYEITLTGVVLYYIVIWVLYLRIKRKHNPL